MSKPVDMKTTNAIKVRKNLTATEARQLSDNSFSLESDIYKTIRSYAAENRVSVTYSIYGASDVAVNKVVAKLISDGYVLQFVNYNRTEGEVRSTKYTQECDTIIISW